MRLKEFHGYGIRGYQDHHITFRDDMTFFIGVNGSGKTTVLNLIQGLLRPSYRTLDSIEFRKIEVTFTIEEGLHTIKVSCEKSKEYFKIEVEKDYLEIAADIFLRSNDTEERNENSRESEDEYERKSYEFSILQTVKQIASYKAPMFLTLDRIPQNVRASLLRRTGRYPDPRRTPIRGNVDTCLIAIQEAIRGKRTYNTNKQSQFILDLRNSIIKTSLSSLAGKSYSTKGNKYLFLKRNEIEKREHDFLEALKGLEIPDLDNISKEFFEKLKKATQTLESKGLFKMSFVDFKIDAQDREVLEAFFTCSESKGRLAKMDEIVAHWHSYQEKVANLQEPLKRFEDCVNMFFAQTGKRFYFDTNGNMIVSTHAILGTGVVNNIMELSSGEKQIVAMLGSLIFLVDSTNPEYDYIETPNGFVSVSSDDKSRNTSNATTEVFLIDEPEVSLHLAWQDIFVDALLKACPKYQFVLATHSPNIVGEAEHRDWCVDLSPKFLKDESI